MAKFSLVVPDLPAACKIFSQRETIADSLTRLIIYPALQTTSEVVQIQRLRISAGRNFQEGANEGLRCQRRATPIGQPSGSVRCARKYRALLKGQPSMLITSLHYFSGLVEEVQASEVGDNYWLHVQRKADQNGEEVDRYPEREHSGETGRMMETK